MDSINLDEIVDPYDKSRSYYIVEITKAAPYQKDSKEHIESIALELVIQEKCGELDDEERYKFKGKPLSMNMSLDSKRIWLLKNLCTALEISGTHQIDELCKMLVGKRIRASIMTNDDLAAEAYYRIIRNFKKAG